MTRAQAQVAALQSEKQTWQREKATLDGRVQQLAAPLTNAAPAPVPVPSVDPDRLKQLEDERQDLRTKLAAAEKALASRVKDLETRITVLQARLAVYEAPAVPFTAEELALFKTPVPTQPNPLREPQTLTPPTAEVAALLTEARGFVGKRQLDRAEAKFREVLQRDSTNVEALSKLGAIQLDLHRPAEAEPNLQRAVALAPRNAVSLAYLGRLKLEQTNYNEAASLLSRAAQILPEDPDIQSVLGVALGGQGLRQPAETALRRALLLKPNSSYAHYNLAVIYLGQQPPFVELARWHYQKARSLGLAADSNFEKSLEAKRAALPR